MLSATLTKMAPYGAILLCVSAGMFYLGQNSGKESVQNKWDKEKLAYQNKIIQLQADVIEKQNAHAIESQRISNELSNLKTSHVQDIAAINAEYSKRLFQSSQRADIYQRQAEAGTDQCRGLASHAAQLDRSLEEGIKLVGEFKATLEQRDGQIRLLGQQILSDRKVLDDDESGSRVPAK